MVARIASVECSFRFITVRNEVAKVMSLQVSVCPQGGSASVHVGIHPPNQAPAWDQTPPDSRPPDPRSRHPLDQAPPGSRHPPIWEQTPPSLEAEPPPSRRLLLRTVRILLECILV